MCHALRYGQFYNLELGRFYRGMFNMENFKYYKIVQGKKSRFIKFSSLIFCHFCSFESGKFHREIMLVENFKLRLKLFVQSILIQWKILNSI